MKTRLLRKLRREAKRYVKIVNELEYGRYAIIRKDKEQKDSNFPITYFQWPLYGTFLPENLHSWKKDLNDVIEQLPRARRCYIYSRLFDIRIERSRTELRKNKLKENTLIHYNTMARRLTDTYFVKCSFSIRLETCPQRLSTKTSTGVYVIPDNELLSEYIETATERQVKDTFGDQYKIADFSITEITPL